MAGRKKNVVETTEKKEEVITSKTMKVKMLTIYCGDVNLYCGKIYELDSKLANELVKNGDAEKC